LIKLTVRIALFSLLAVAGLSLAITKNFGQPIVTVAGVYENFTVGKASGDLEGMRVVIVPAGGGYYAIVQIAQGGAEDPKPEFVPAAVKGKSVSFSVGDEKFTGSATAAGLNLTNAAGESQALKRKACTAYFK
jgi:hypothetical protein